MSDLIDSLRYHAEKAECGDTNVNEDLHDAANLIDKLQQERDVLAAHVERLRGSLQKVLDDSEIGVVPKSHLDSIESLLEATPHQSLAERDAEVARKGYETGWDDAFRLVDGRSVNFDNVDEYAERVKG